MQQWGTNNENNILCHNTHKINGEQNNNNVLTFSSTRDFYKLHASLLDEEEDSDVSDDESMDNCPPDNNMESKPAR
eukprot:703414-Ditylum_brightwellii.AAC.1